MNVKGIDSFCFLFVKIGQQHVTSSCLLLVLIGGLCPIYEFVKKTKNSLPSGL